MCSSNGPCDASFSETKSKNFVESEKMFGQPSPVVISNAWGSWYDIVTHTDKVKFGRAQKQHQSNFICPYDLVANSVGCCFAKYRKIPVIIQLSNVFWARSNNLGSLYIGEGTWSAGGGGGNYGKDQARNEFKTMFRDFITNPPVLNGISTFLSHVHVRRLSADARKRSVIALLSLF